MDLAQPNDVLALHRIERRYLQALLIAAKALRGMNSTCVLSSSGSWNNGKAEGTSPTTAAGPLPCGRNRSALTCSARRWRGTKGDPRINDSRHL
jgi:hypothetical protein